MTPHKHLPILAFTLTILLIAAGCHKSNSPATSPTTALTSDSTGHQVRTPFGLVDKSTVHYIGEGYRLRIVNNRIQKFEKSSGKMVEDFGEVKPNEARFNLRNLSTAGHSNGSAANHSNGSSLTVNGLGSDGRVPAPASGWIADANWTNNTGTPITQFITSWVVPSNPVNPSGQTLFLFNGMQDGLTSTSYILQPVLQWGGSAAGGGQYWSITNWFVSSSLTFYGPLITVSSGTNLQGVMAEVSSSGSSYNYVSYFSGYSPAIEIEGIPQPTWCAETLEAYGVTDENTQYPPNTDIAMYGIQILLGSNNANLSWATGQATPGSALRANVVSNASPGGEVDIYFR
ncbi:MAG TPA: hypothetical protein VNS58_31400 [Puia sp.]|nr:hypothetical protein [Puia sp.]